MRLVDLTVSIPSKNSKAPLDEAKSPERWRTLEFRVYMVVACVVLPIMAWIPISLSSSTHPNYPFYKSRLSPGWIPFRQVDNSDAQYRSFRNNIPVLTVLACVYLFVKFIWVGMAAAPPQNNLYLIPFNLVFSVLMLLGLHGTSCIKIFIILTVNYAIAKICKGSKIGPLLTWIFNGAVLFANDRYNGYPFGDISPALQFLDAYPGFYPRWYISFNITMLRLVSFNMDYYWACNSRIPLETNPRNMSERDRQKFAHPKPMHSYPNYLSYVLYPPLYIAGPIMTFNDFLWQHRRPLLVTGRTALLYFIRFIATLLTMELILHFMYVVAIKDRKAWVGATPAEISMIGFWNLIIVWLKLLIPWRFFRLWALMDGIDPPENMVRCMANNYSTSGFWRSWHRSYNLWIIRYIYIPLGGAKNVILNTILVFSFVALWHDLTFRLLAWGWLISLFVLPELLASFLLPASKFGSKGWYRHVCAIGAIVNILMMMAGNLVGFVIGTDGVRFFMDELLGTSAGLRFLLGAFVCLFVGAQLMFEYREEEKRHGIYRRC
ncbi:MBOAT, membrane-bound O-acyltransferase family-domain-containing protein [Collybia nuda]|uniref:MBOAT, membrane-bound O-acyltransferase family-domain-containing protein n=1 Tax=Collybia nuda TaxID=64659 RepID=A0A9P6CFK2_9AGAR|nr:MBOAT, membrane-bound O-acyltransferase family-domain-containing protein [Collybia nuda]